MRLARVLEEATDARDFTAFLSPGGVLLLGVLPLDVSLCLCAEGVLLLGVLLPVVDAGRGCTRCRPGTEEAMDGDCPASLFDVFLCKLRCCAYGVETERSLEATWLAERGVQVLAGRGVLARGVPARGVWPRGRLARLPLMLELSETSLAPLLDRAGKLRWRMRGVESRYSDWCSPDASLIDGQACLPSLCWGTLPPPVDGC